MSENKEHIDTSFIQNLHPNGGFEVPEGYFVQLQETILNKTSNNGFSVPEHYFNELEERIEAKLKNPVQPKRLVIIRNLKYASAIAASLLIFGSLYLWLSKPQASPVDFSALSDEEIINYIEVSDIQDHKILEMAIKSESSTTKDEEEYLINTADADLIIDEL